MEESQLHSKFQSKRWAYWNTLEVFYCKTQVRFPRVRFLGWDFYCDIPEKYSTKNHKHKDIFVWEIAVKIPSKKTHLGKCTFLCSLKVIIWVNVKKAHSRKRAQLNGLWIQVLEWENIWMCFSRHNSSHKPLAFDFLDGCSSIELLLLQTLDIKLKLLNRNLYLLLDLKAKYCCCCCCC